MSLCISFFNQGEIFVWADSRVSTEIDGKNYLITDEYQKVRQIGDKVIFITGDAELAVQLFEAVKAESTVQFIRDMASSYYREFVEINGDNPAYQTEHGIELGLHIFTLENDVPVYYQTHYQNDFEMCRLEPADQELFSVGAHSDKALVYADELCRNGLTLDVAVIKTYEHVADEIVGGYLSTFVISTKGIRHYASRIQESKTYPKWRGRPFRFHADMQGNVLANSLTANYAKIKSSNFTDGAIVGSSINVGNGKFTVSSAGDLYAQGGILTQGTITGALIRTAASGQRIEMDSSGLRAKDSSVNRIVIAPDNSYGVSEIALHNESGVKKGSLYSFGSRFGIQGFDSMLINGNEIVFNANVNFDIATVRGLRKSSVEGLGDELTSLGSQINAKASKGINTDTAGPYNCGIPIGTQFKALDGSVHTWAGVPAHSHTQR